MIRRLSLLAALALITTTPGFAQDDDIDAQIKKAMENANQPAAKKPDMKKMERETIAEIDKAEAEEKAAEAKQRAAMQAIVDVKGPVSLPDWTPQVPQFHAVRSARAQVSRWRAKGNRHWNLAASSSGACRCVG
jgi:uncharacterized protein (DUF3084 family)